MKNNWLLASIFDFIKLKYLGRGLLISIIVVILPQAVGTGAILSYMQIIFEAANVNLAPEICVIVVGFFQLIGAILSCLTIEKVGRRFLLLSSCVFVSLTLFVLGLYFCLKNGNYNIEVISWLPLLSLVVFIISSNLGISSVCWVVMAELFHPNVAAIAAAISSSCCFLLSFIVILIFPIFSLYLGIYGCFFLFSITCVAGGLFIYFTLPETKGKSSQEISVLLGYDEQFAN